MLLVIFKQRGKQSLKLVSQVAPRGETNRLNVLHGRKPRFQQVEIHRYAAHDHVDLQKMKPFKFDLPCPAIFLCFCKGERVKKQEAGDPVVKPTFVVDDLFYHP